MVYPSLQAANELLRQHGDVDPMKLQKLLYYANGWWLALNGRPLLNEQPQVWRYGPVFRGLYGTFARFGHAAIGGPVKAGPFTPEPPTFPNDQAGNHAREFLEWIWQEHGHKSAVQLSDETHAPGTPWRRIAEQHNFAVPQGTPIPPALDWDFFSKLAVARGVPTQPLRV